MKEVRVGLECGIKLGDFNEYQVGDIIECYQLEQVRAEIVRALNVEAIKLEAAGLIPVQRFAFATLTATTMKHRLLRVNELLKRELSTLFVREMTFEDALVTVNQVDVTPDLKSAHVYVSVLGTEGRKDVLRNWKRIAPRCRPIFPSTSF